MLLSWRSLTKIAGSGAGSGVGSLSQRNESADPDPYQNVMVVSVLAAGSWHIGLEVFWVCAAVDTLGSVNCLLGWECSCVCEKVELISSVYFTGSFDNLLGCECYCVYVWCLTVELISSVYTLGSVQTVHIVCWDDNVAVYAWQWSTLVSLLVPAISEIGNN